MLSSILDFVARAHIKLYQNKKQYSMFKVFIAGEQIRKSDNVVVDIVDGGASH